MADLATITAHDLQDLGITEQIHADLMLRSIRQIVQSAEVGSPLGSARKINSKQLWGQTDQPMCTEMRTNPFL